MEPVRDGARPRAARPRALPRGRRRPHVGARPGQPRHRAAAGRRRSRPARAAGERPARQPAPVGHGAEHRQPRRLARAPARAPAPADRGDGRPAARVAARRAGGLSRPRPPPGAPEDLGDVCVPLRLRTRPRRAVVHLARSRRSAPPWTSPWRSSRSSRSSPRTPRPRRSCATTWAEARSSAAPGGCRAAAARGRARPS